MTGLKGLPKKLNLQWMPTRRSLHVERGRLRSVRKSVLANICTASLVGWLVGFGFNGPLRQYFSLYRAVSQREREREERIDESKNVQTTPTRTYCKRNRPLPYCNQNCRTPQHWKFTQHHRTTRPPPYGIVIRIGQTRNVSLLSRPIWLVGCLGLTAL